MARIRQSLVDKKVQSFFEWKRDFIAEDVKEFGCELKRPPGEYGRLYQMYLKFQNSAEAKAARDKM